MIKQTNLQAGFSAIELLITLFITAAFLGTGYQLYSVIIKDGGDTRMRASASNIAYNALQKYSTQATNPCAAVTPSPTPTLPAGHGLSSAAISVVISCPFGIGNSATSKVSVSVTYGTPQQKVVHALYVTN